MFNQQELQLIAQLVSRAQISAGDSVPVAMLLQKIQGMINTTTPKEKEEKKDKKG